MKSRHSYLASLAVAGLVLGGLIPTPGSAQEILRSAPTRVDVINFLGYDTPPLPVEVTNELTFSEVPTFQIEREESPRPPWIAAGRPWIETPKLTIRAVVGDWVELTNPNPVDLPAEESLPAAKIKANQASIWLYLPTGIIYANPTHRHTYQYLVTTPPASEP